MTSLASLFFLAGFMAVFLVIFHLVISRQVLNQSVDYRIVLERVAQSLDRVERLTVEEMGKSREESNRTLKGFNESVLNRMTDIATMQKNQLDSFSKQLMAISAQNETRLDKMRETIEKRLTILQDDNNKKLEKMRETVDEKLHATLEKRLGESFKLVGDRLELVHKGLGEMKSLAAGVGDLKKVLTNVKTRGTWGEVQLGNLLEQIFSPDQYGKNVQIKKGSQERVEYAVRLPGKTDGGDPVWLPIDAKFPQDIFHELIESQESGDRLLVDASERKLESRIKLEANAMSEKYIDPPTTTDFGVIFLPTEGLYAEVLKIRGLHQLLQDKYRILIAGPTTLAALLNSLQMGFRTLAIEKRSSEVWTVLKTVKTEFGKFGDLLEKTHKKLQEAGNTIENAARKSRTIEKKLGRVEDLPQEEEPVMMTGAEATSPLFKASGEA